MKTRKFGTTGRDVPVIGQGTWYIEKGSRAAAIAALRTGMDLGMTHIDTAEMYGSGEAEDVVAEAVHGRRGQAFIVSKVLPNNASRDGTVKACEASLRRLKTDHLDCYLLHWPGSHPLEDTIAAFEKLKADGKIRAWGVSNFDVSELDETLAISGPGKIARNQVLYHITERAIEHGVIPWCETHNVAVVGYSPFGHNQFPKPSSAGGKVLDQIAKSRNATVHQVVLAFLTRRPSLFTIPKASDAKHAQENAAAGDVRLTDADIAALDYTFPAGRKRGLPMI